MTMELSMTIALLSALAIGQFFTAIVIAFFVLFAELLESLVDRQKNAVHSPLEANGYEPPLGAATSVPCKCR
jgi:cation transport ATPase